MIVLIAAIALIAICLNKLIQWESIGIHLDIFGFIWIPPNLMNPVVSIGIYRNSLRTIRIYCNPFGSVGIYWDPLGFIGILGSIEIHYNPLESIRVHWDPEGSIGNLRKSLSPLSQLSIKDCPNTLLPKTLTSVQLHETIAKLFIAMLIYSPSNNSPHYKIIRVFCPYY